MLLQSSIPVFPFELFNCIIDELGYREFENEFRVGQLDALRSCAIVCKTFNELCRVHIFGYVEFNNSSRDSDARRQCLLRFMDVMEREISLKSHVQEFKITFTDYIDTTLMDHEFDRWSTVLLSFPNLRRLAIDQEPQLMDELQFQWFDLGSTLAETYFKQGTLRSIQLQEVTGWPFEDLLVSPSLRKVDIGGTEIPEFVLPTSLTITSLRVYDTPDLPLSVLPSFPNLDNLELEHVSEFIPGEQDSRTVPCNIKTLRVHGCGPTNELFRLLYSGTPDKSTWVFDSLEKLEFSPGVSNEDQTLRKLLERTPSLQTLSIDVSDFALVTMQFQITELNLAEHISQTFSSLKELNMNAQTFLLAGPTSNIDTVMELFASIANNNVLEKLTITIHGEIIEYDLPSQEPWSQLASLLASTLAFPCLNSVEVNLRFEIVNRKFPTFEKELKGGQQELDQFILVAMSELANREGMKLGGCLSVDRY